MRGDAVPDGDAITRYCPGKKMEGGLPLVTAFELRRGEEYLSVNWLQYWKGIDQATALERVRRDVSKRLDLSKKGAFAVLNAGTVKSVIEEVTRGHAFVTQQPSRNNLSHAGVFGFGITDFEVATALANAVDTADVAPAIVDSA